MGPVTQETVLGNALISYFSSYWAGDPILFPQVSLPLALPFDWLPNFTDPASAYPCNPYLQTPAAYLRLYTETLTLDYLAAGQAFSVEYAASIWYYRRQVPGEKHQQILSQDLEKVRNPLLIDAFKPSLAVPNFRLISAIPGQTVFHNHLSHEFDDHFLRVSVGEVPITIKGVMTLC